MVVSGTHLQLREPRLMAGNVGRCEGWCYATSPPFRILPRLASVIKGCMSSVAMWFFLLRALGPPWEGSRSWVPWVPWVPWAPMQSSGETEAAQSSPLRLPTHQ